MKYKGRVGGLTVNHPALLGLMRSRVPIFLLTGIPVKTMLKKCLGLCTKGFDDSAKDLHFLRFHNGTRNVLVNTGEDNFSLIFQRMLPKHVHMSQTFKEDINIKYLFYVFFNHYLQSI